jgi:hypothetical protein
MTNAEAIAIGTERFLEANKEQVFARIYAGAEAAAMTVAESVGLQISARVAKFLKDNTQDFLAAVAMQAVIGAESKRMEGKRNPVVIPEEQSEEGSDVQLA